MNKKSALRTITALAITLLVAPTIYPQCSSCAPGIKQGYSPGDPLKFYLDPGLSQTEANAAANAVNAWNAWFEEYCLPPPYSIVGTAIGSDVCIEQDPTLDPGNPGTFNNATSTIDLNPQYSTAADLMNTVVLHEIGHAIGFSDVGSSCAYQSVMDGFLNSDTGPFMNGLGSADECALSTYNPPPPPPPPDPPSNCSADWVGGCSPIVIHFGRGYYRLTGTESAVLFDIAATGNPIRIGWTAPGADEAFLCLDRNHNGMIDSGAELFGNATPLKNGLRAGNGFIALAEYDDNGDGVIDARDPIWSHFLLWRDLNHDGASQPDELQPIVGSGVTAIGLDYRWTGRRDAFGNLFKYRSTVWMTNHGGKDTARPVYDIFFVRVP